MFCSIVLCFLCSRNIWYCVCFDRFRSFRDQHLRWANKGTFIPHRSAVSKFIYIRFSHFRHLLAASREPSDSRQSFGSLWMCLESLPLETSFLRLVYSDPLSRRDECNAHAYRMTLLSYPWKRFFIPPPPKRGPFHRCRKRAHR